jgi:chemotaxis response regulator CheB
MSVLKIIFSALPVDFLPIIIVQHLGPHLIANGLKNFEFKNLIQIKEADEKKN